MIIANIVAGFAVCIVSIIGGDITKYINSKPTANESTHQAALESNALRTARLYYLPGAKVDSLRDSCAISIDKSKFGYISFDLVGCVNSFKEAYVSSVFYNSTMLPGID